MTFSTMKETAKGEMGQAQRIYPSVCQKHYNQVVRKDLQQQESVIILLKLYWPICIIWIISIHSANYT